MRISKTCPLCRSRKTEDTNEIGYKGGFYKRCKKCRNVFYVILR